MIQASGAILAGGKSRRMGKEKAFLEIGREEMIRRVAAELEKTLAEVLVVGGDPGIGPRLGLRFLPDLLAGSGPLGGIYAALKGATYEKCLVTACDMPFVSSELACYLLGQAKDWDVTVPRHGPHLQPLFAVYSSNCLGAIEQTLRANRYKVIDFYPQVRVNYVNEKDLKALADLDVAFFNVNTPRDLEAARAMEKSLKSGE